MREIIGDYEAFIRGISVGLEKVGIARGELAMMDHICYRVETQARYNALLLQLSRPAILLGESVISGREIATFEFPDYLQVDGWTVPYLELPEPKEGSPYPEGLEHAELVVIGGLERFAKRHEGLAFDAKGMTKDLNPELGLKTNQLSVKFHEQPLGAVMRIEQRIGRA
jgi:predicted metalloenzyme YecM